ncbi:Rhodanese-like domain-containing protein [Achaetomium macrosporum]|uniref:Rhodanese-like domain-containing protein n=1 Tax=Achaetomium macrosporum TaxID=79813 RepID=A0AAN7HCU5_9PEZI|nr:Rhodanese-like domain-containing protein [Achaetomium macrosporum]
MESRRAAVSLMQALGPSARTASPARVRAAAQLPLRQYHNHTSNPRHAVQLLQQSSTAYASRPSSLLSRVGPRLTTARSYYSTDAESKPSKIWDFEALQELTTSPNPSVTIIDVREPHELQGSGRIPGALNIPVGSAPDSFHISDEEFEDRFGYPRPAPDAEVVFYCRAGVRSRAAAGLAREAGWKKVGEYPGSWLDWFEKGGKVER